MEPISGWPNVPMGVVREPIGVPVKDVVRKWEPLWGFGICQTWCLEPFSRVGFEEARHFVGGPRSFDAYRDSFGPKLIASQKVEKLHSETKPL